MTWRTTAAAGAIVLAAGAAAVVAGGDRPTLSQPVAHPRTVPVTAATLSCPAVQRPNASTTRIFAVTPAAAPSSGTGDTSTGRLRVLDEADRPMELAATARPGVPLRAASTTPGALVEASGALAAGASGAALTAYTSPTTTGISASPCVAARAQWWFTGVDTSVGTTTRLELSNTGSGIAVVDVLFLGPGGPISAPGAQGVALAPQSRTLLDLAGFAPGRAALTLRVTASRGAVAAAVSTSRLDGLTPTGTDVVPAAADPARSLVVAAGVPTATRQRLVVTNPGDGQQLVGVRLLDQDGAFVPSALPSLQVPPGSVVVRDITALVGTGAAAVELTAAEPVTGAVVSDVTGDARDFAVAGVGTALTTPAAAPTMEGARLTLAMTATTAAPHRVDIATFDRSGERLGVVEVVARGSATTSWSLPRTSAASYVVLTAGTGGGPVQAVATYAGPGGVTQLPVVSGRTTVQQPAVVPAYP